MGIPFIIWKHSK